MKRLSEPPHFHERKETIARAWRAAFPTPLSQVDATSGTSYGKGSYDAYRYRGYYTLFLVTFKEEIGAQDS